MAEKFHFITGVVVRKESLESTVLHRKKDELDIAGEFQIPLDLPEGADLQSPQGVASIKAAGSKIRGTACVGIPTGKTLMRVLDLPTTDPEELGDMVDIQVDKYSPFPVEHMLISYETLVESEDTTRVLVAAVQRSQVDEIGDVFIEAGILPHWIDVEVLGWWHLLQSKGEIPEQGRFAILLCDREGTELIITQDGSPLIFRSLGYHDEEMSREEFVSEIAEEAAYTLTSLESEWGQMHTSLMHLWHWDQVPEDLIARIQDECGVDIERHRFEDLPTLSEGLARRAVGREGTMIDLSPQEWHATEKARLLRRRLLGATAALVLGWGLIMSTLFFLAKYQEGRLNRALKTESELEQPAQQVKVLYARVESLKQYADRTYSGLEYLREASMLKPNGLDLSSFAYKKSKSLNLRGQATSANPIYDFLEKLEQSNLFVEVKMDDIRNKVVRGVRVSEFKIDATLPGEEEL